MDAVTLQRRPPLGFFPDQAAPRLYDRIIEVLRVRHYSRRTEEAYVHWIRRYIEFHQHAHPRQLAEGDVNRFLTHLAVRNTSRRLPRTRLCRRSCFSTSTFCSSRSTASKASFARVGPNACRSF